MLDLRDTQALITTGAETIAAAASGSLEAQRQIVAAHLQGFPPPDMLLRAEIVARMAAAQGDAEDRRALVAILWSIALAAVKEAPDMVRFYAIAAISAARELVDEGDGPALNMLADIGKAFPEVLADIDGADDLPPPALVFPLAPLLEPLPAQTWRDWLSLQWWSAYWLARRIGWAVSDWFKERF